MKLLDRLILVEFIGPFIFGVALFTALLTSTVYLFGLTDYFVQGASVLLVLQLMLLYLPGMIAWTFPMSSLLAVLLGFGRLSSDSELIAVLASGINFWRVVAPVAAAGLVISGVALLFSEEIVPRSSQEAAKLKATIVQQIGRSHEPVFMRKVNDGKLAETVVADSMNFERNIMYRVTVTRYDPKTGEPSLVVFANTAIYDKGDWRYRDVKAVDSPLDKSIRSQIESGSLIVKNNLDIKKTPQQIVMDMVPAENLGSRQILQRIENEKREKKDNVLGLQVEYYNKFAVPLSSIVFCLVATPLGIRNPRRGGVALGWVATIGIIISYWVLMRFMGVLGSGGAIAPWFAAFGPDMFGISIAIILLMKRSH